MRPLLLEITGLHSFRERRSIDFEPLLRDNLFGIFGPTGGGKSTILDAMTLALFGKIERTKGQEIASAINAREKECVVAFTFAVREEGAERRYRVERLYRLQKSGMKSEARLVDLSATPPVVLADKTSEVSGLIEKILGIRSHDFRLSVVLPQGAFAEFLHLRPKDRGEMLQRIFGLEELGTRINNRLREFRAELDRARTGVEARMESLKEYDDEALHARREELRHATAEAERSRAQIAEAERERNEAEALYELIAGRNQLLEKEEERREERERLGRLRAELKREEEANALTAVVAQARNAQARLEAARADYRRAEDRRAEAEENMVPLRERRQRAELEKGKDGRLVALEQQIRALEGLAEIDERIGLLLSSIQTRGEKIAEAETRLRRNEIEIEEGRRLELQAQNDVTALAAKIEAIDDDEKNLRKRGAAVEHLELLVRQNEEKAKLLKKIVGEEEELTGRLKGLADDIGTTQKREEHSSVERTNARQRYEEARIGNALGEALPLLRDGSPCPLCGATDHPHPYSHTTDHDLRALALLVEQAEHALTAATDHLRSLEKEETSLLTQTEGIAKRRQELEIEFRKGDEEIASVATQTEYRGETDADTLRGWKEKIAGLLVRREEEREKTKTERITLETALRNATETIAAGRDEIAKLTQAIASDREERNREEKELENIREKRRERLDRIALDVEEGESERNLAERKSELSRLKRAIEEIEELFESGEKRLNSAANECGRCLALQQREEEETHRTEREREERFAEKGFASIDEWENALLSPAERKRREQEADILDATLNDAERRLKELSEAIGERDITGDELAARRREHAQAREQREQALTALGKAEQAATECEAKNAEWRNAAAESARNGREHAALRELSGHLQGNAFINFLADERLQQICRTASGQLRELTGGRLEIGSRSDEGFFIRDNGNGGAERPPGSLSGGETFLVSLALSLALSDSLQVGRSPMEFFFLDEGFGTLDDDLLEVVLDSLERLRGRSQRAIGVISHVPQLRERIPRRLIVTAATESNGTDVRPDIS